MAKVWVPETRVLWEHSAAWIAVETLEAVAEKGEGIRTDGCGVLGGGRVNGLHTAAVERFGFVALCVGGCWV
jgi:hypothetical protein